MIMMMRLMQLSMSVNSMMAKVLSFLRSLIPSAPLINIAAQVAYAVLKHILRRGNQRRYNLLDATIGVTTVGILLDALEIIL